MNSIKAFIVLGTLLMSSFAMAQGCVDEKGNDVLNDPGIFTEVIARKETCHEAIDLAKACAWGASVDYTTTSIAMTVCSYHLEKLSPKEADMNLLRAMIDRCEANHDADGGTMAISETGFCRLSAYEFVYKMYRPQDVF
ncbi:hypothetical protein [Bdellovibrio sp. HCB209]|uniref:hypothetical protein n=1 Tax=Bdellovibrio sp. HCB209 TaxID=3394354 RepID=UPI0039B55320